MTQEEKRQELLWDIFNGLEDDKQIKIYNNSNCSGEKIYEMNNDNLWDAWFSDMGAYDLMCWLLDASIDTSDDYFTIDDGMLETFSYVSTYADRYEDEITEYMSDEGDYDTKIAKDMMDAFFEEFVVDELEDEGIDEDSEKCSFIRKYIRERYTEPIDYVNEDWDDLYFEADEAWEGVDGTAEEASDED